MSSSLIGLDVFTMYMDTLQQLRDDETQFLNNYVLKVEEVWTKAVDSDPNMPFWALDPDTMRNLNEIQKKYVYQKVKIA